MPGRVSERALVLVAGRSFDKSCPGEGWDVRTGVETTTSNDRSRYLKQCAIDAAKLRSWQHAWHEHVSSEIPVPRALEMRGQLSGDYCVCT
jgi:hypothetical protein